MMSNSTEALLNGNGLQPLVHNPGTKIARLIDWLNHSVHHTVYWAFRTAIAPLRFIANLQVTEFATLREVFFQRSMQIAVVILPLMFMQKVSPNWATRWFFHVVGLFAALPFNVPRQWIQTDKFKGWIFGDSPITPQTCWILYIHGGGYMAGSPLLYVGMFKSMFVHLKERGVDMRVLSLQYDLVSQRTKYDGLITQKLMDEGLAAYDWLTRVQGIDPKYIVCMGDSAGGNAILGLNLLMREKKVPQPNTLVLCSPWVDVSLDWLPLDTDCQDWFHTKLVRGFVDWHNSIAPEGHKNPILSPTHADLRGLPPMYISYAARELLAGSNREFCEKARKAEVLGVEAVSPNTGIHVYPVLAVLLEGEAEKELIAICDWISKRMLA